MVERCYSTGAVSDGTDTGGLAGLNIGCIESCYWDVNTSGYQHSAGGTGRSTAQMQSRETFRGWACCDLWRVDEGKDYPRLIWENTAGMTIARSEYGGGSGTAEDPHQIYTADQLHALGGQYCDWDKHFVLMDDIDLGGYDGKEGRASFNIIGYGASSCISNRSFSGVFDGNGHSISNFTWQSAEADRVGIFGTVRRLSYREQPNAEVKNIVVVNPSVDVGGGICVAGLIGCAGYGSNISDCHVIGGHVDGGDCVGGLLGLAGGSPGTDNSNAVTVSRCSSDTSVSGGQAVGGLVGGSEYQHYHFKGWIVLEDSSSSGTVQGGEYSGGLIGAVWGEAHRCFAIADVSGEEAVGGLAGYFRGRIKSCFASGAVLGYEDVGGLLGRHYSGIVEDSYALTNVAGKTGVGGLVGQTYSYDLRRCFSGGPVDGIESVGGLVGYYRKGGYPGYEDYVKCFWDSDINPDVNGIGNMDDHNVIGESTDNMQSRSTFSSAGWHFVDEVRDGVEGIWTICEQTNYPKLVWQLSPADLVCPDGVTAKDFCVFAQYWLNEMCGASNEFCSGADLDTSGRVDANDLGIFTGEWLDEASLVRVSESLPEHPPPPARDPYPADGTTSVRTMGLMLSWHRDTIVTSYDIYVGLDFNAVSAADVSSPEYRRRQTTAVYELAALSAHTTYYWRVDSINLWDVTIGPVWTFTTGSGPVR
jgi:hypothetical protein